MIFFFGFFVFLLQYSVDLNCKSSSFVLKSIKIKSMFVYKFNVFFTVDLHAKLAKTKRKLEEKIALVEKLTRQQYSDSRYGLVDF